MKLSHAQLEPHLKKNLSSIYIISGEELLLKRDAIALIRKAAKLAGFNEHVRLTPDTHFDWDELYPLFYATSLLAEKRLLELHLAHCTLNKTASKLLQEYAENPSPHNLVLIDIGKIDNKIAKSAWYKSLEKKAVLVSIWPIARDQLPAWIIQYAKKYKLHILDQAANLLAEYVEGNLLAAHQAIEKFYLLQLTKPIDSEVVKSVLTDQSQFTIFELVESLIAGNVSRSLYILENLREEGIEPTLILWGITRELRLLAEMAQQYQQGLSCESLLQKYRIYARRQAAIRHFLSTHSAKHCWQYLMQAAELDKLAKGAVPGNVWRALELFCLRVV
ncbi:MAG: DNA polymerase III subunit delta [Gammaproteobacteria bacterium]|nr:DNA polymerase III subunit delta [Gammaproteobacteria bacterium]